MPVEDVVGRPRQDRARPGRGRGRASALPAPAPRVRRRLSALHPAHRDGHRGRRRGRQPDPGRGRRLHARLGSRSARSRRLPLLVARGGAALVGTRLDDDALRGAAAPQRAPPADPIDDKRGTAAYRTQAGRRADPARRRDRAARARERGTRWRRPRLSKRHVRRRSTAVTEFLCEAQQTAARGAARRAGAARAPRRAVRPAIAARAR